MFYMLNKFRSTNVFSSLLNPSVFLNSKLGSHHQIKCQMPNVRYGFKVFINITSCNISPYTESFKLYMLYDFPCMPSFYTLNLFHIQKYSPHAGLIRHWLFTLWHRVWILISRICNRETLTLCIRRLINTFVDLSWAITEPISVKLVNVFSTVRTR